MQKKISIFSFFAGIGILDLAFEKSGYNIVFVNEYDDLFMASYQYARTQMTHLVPLYGYHNDSAERYAKKRGKRKLINLVAKEREKDFELYSMIETLAPKVIADERKIYKGVSANVDFYSGFVYSMLDIPLELFTPIFAMARIVGWSAHRLEELTNVDKIIRPAYQSVQDEKEYIEMEDR